MAKHTITKLIDDLDGGDADETVKFGLDGVQYEIDLSAKNADKLREAFAPYVAAGSKMGRVPVGVGARVSPSRRRGAQSVDREQNKAIRDWARKQGRQISDRGRIPEEIVAEYHARAGS
jgi:hypothetical protein